MFVLFGVETRHPNLFEKQAHQLRSFLKSELFKESSELGQVIAEDRFIDHQRAAVVDFHLELLTLHLQVTLALSERIGLSHEVAGEVPHLWPLGHVDERGNFLGGFIQLFRDLPELGLEWLHRFLMLTLRSLCGRFDYVKMLSKLSQ